GRTLQASPHPTPSGEARNILSPAGIFEGGFAMRHPAAVLATFLAVQALVPVAQASTIRTVVGGGPDNLPALLANLDRPTEVAEDGAGNLYLAQGANSPCRVFKIDPFGVLTHVAGTGESFTAPPFGDGGLAVEASLAGCNGLAVDPAGNLYISDGGHGN